MNDKLIFRIIVAISVFVFAVVVLLNRKILPVPEVIPDFVYRLPRVNAVINATCTVLLLFSLYFIRQGNIAVHRKLNLAAFVLSSMFLVSYITYHWMAVETVYPKENPLRPLYLFILVSHIVLAALVLPLILLSFYRGLQMQVELHKKIVRWSFPVWLYVTITGVVVYLMLAPYYTH